MNLVAVQKLVFQIQLMILTCTSALKNKAACTVVAPVSVGSVLLHHCPCPHMLSSSSSFSLRISLKLLLVQGDQLPSFYPSAPFEWSGACDGA